MRPAAHDLAEILEHLEQPDVRAWIPEHLATLRAGLKDALIVDERGQRIIRRGDRPLGRILPFGSVVLYGPGATAPLRHRLLQLDRGGRVTLAVRRGAGGELRAVWVRNVDDTMLGVLPGDAEHPVWGPSDRIVALVGHGRTALLTVCGRIRWDAIAAIPPLAEPARLPPGGGTGILNALASLAADQEAGALRYRGPYPTEQLFWSLLESFRFAPYRLEDPVGLFTAQAEAAFVTGQLREAPVDWIAAPHERLFLSEGIVVQLRDGVEKVYWAGRTYSRPHWQGLKRREYRVIRPMTTAEGDLGFVASIEALGRTLEEHLTFDATGDLIERRPAPSETETGGDTPLADAWREALAALLPLEATRLLATAIAAVWPTFTVVWGVVPCDLIETRGATLRLSRRLVRTYLAERATLPGVSRRPLAQHLVRDVLGVVGPPVRRAAAAWLEAQPATNQEAQLEAAVRLDRAVVAAPAAERLGALLDALEVGDALPR